jgi:radical SAM protein with 4Fe4S-binding SPASM domain
VSRYAELMELAAARLQPVSAHLEITRACHQECTICYQAGGDGAELTTAEWAGVIAQLRDIGTFTVTVSGGEIFLRPDALDIARAARTVGLSVRLATTGTLLDEARCAEIAELRPADVGITVFSLDPARHDRITRRPGSLGRAVEGIRRLRGLGVHVTILTPLLRSAWAKWEEIGALAREIGASHLIDPCTNGCDDGDLAPLAERLGPRDLAALYASPLLTCTLAPPADPRSPPCKVARATLVVGPGGDVLPCVLLREPLGNVRQQSLRDIWEHSPFLAQLRETVVGGVRVCNTCARSGYCGRCPGIALAEDGDLNGPSGWACRVAEAKEFAAAARARADR